jgi:hypothetical protein
MANGEELEPIFDDLTLEVGAATDVAPRRRLATKPTPEPAAAEDADPVDWSRTHRSPADPPCHDSSNYRKECSGHYIAPLTGQQSK